MQYLLHELRISGLNAVGVVFQLVDVRSLSIARILQITHL